MTWKHWLLGIALALLLCIDGWGCETSKVMLQSVGDGSCNFGAQRPTALACTADACLLCLSGGTCSWVTYRHCGP